MNPPMHMLNAAKSLRTFLTKQGVFNSVAIDDPPNRNKLTVHLVNPNHNKLVPKRWRRFPVVIGDMLPWEITIPTDQGPKLTGPAPTLPPPLPPTTTDLSN